MRLVGPKKVAILITVVAGALLFGLVLFLQRTRTIEGTWIDLFEGSRFFEGQGISSACTPKFMDAPWFSFSPKVNSDVGKLIKANRNSGVLLSKHGSWPVTAYAVKFEGHHKIFGLGFGHLNASPSEYVVDRMISIKPVPSLQCDVRPG